MGKTALLIGARAIVSLQIPSRDYWTMDIRKTLPAEVDAWQVSLNYLMTMVVLAGLAVMAIYWWINRNVLTDTRFYEPAAVGIKKKKAKMYWKAF